MSPILTAFLTTNYGWSAGFIVPGIGTVLLSLFIYCVIWDSPSEIGLHELNQMTSETSGTEHKSVKNKRQLIIALLQSPFLWVLSVGYLMTLFVKTGVGEWTQLFLMQTIEKSQYQSTLLKGRGSGLIILYHYGRLTRSCFNPITARVTHGDRVVMKF